ncbi:hypothetical protein PspLS_06996 [Pyricularia sp. CBS 133598]|nr:hypothetical protein PspLS_06996 [Pyricularia sp. CBS 133598]
MYLGVRRTVSASKEVVVTAGALRSPHLLILLGIGEGGGKWNDKLRFWEEKFHRLPLTLPLPPLARAAEGFCHERPSPPAVGNWALRPDLLFDKGAVSSSQMQRLPLFPGHFPDLLDKTIWTDQDLCIGIAEANRDDVKTARLPRPPLGAFAPTLVVLEERFWSHELEKLVRDTKQTPYQALTNGGVPFELLLHELQEKLTPSRCELEMMLLEPGSLAYDIRIDIVDSGSSGSGDCLVSTMAQKFPNDPEVTDTMAACYSYLVRQLLESPGCALGEVSAFPPAILSQTVKFCQDDRVAAIAESLIPYRGSPAWPTTPTSPYRGDLANDRLGLSTSDAELIFSTADVVLHNGCDVSHMRSYASLKPANYGATR